MGECRAGGLGEKEESRAGGLGEKEESRAGGLGEKEERNWLKSGSLTILGLSNNTWVNE